MKKTNLKKLIIIGTSTAAEAIYNFVLYYNLFEVKGFAVNKEYKTIDKFQGLPVFVLEDIDNYIDKENDLLFVAMQWNRLNKDRRNVYKKLKIRGYKFANIISPNSVVRTDDIGENCWISDLVAIEAGVRIGNNTFIKTNAIIANQTDIANHCFIGMNSSIGGNCKVGEQTFIGISSTIFDQVVIGEKCIIGASTIIKRNISPYSLVKSSVENQQVKQYDSKEIEEKLLANKNVR